MKTRREFLQGLIVSVGGATALSACSGAATIAATAPGQRGRFYTGNEMALVSRISDLIIPRTETPGALDANVPGYLDGLMTDWASDETRSNRREALQLIAARLDAASGDFLSANEDTSIRVLSELDSIAFFRWQWSRRIPLPKGLYYPGLLRYRGRCHGRTQMGSSTRSLGSQR